MPEQTVELARFKPISQYRPRIGDFVIYHGWFWTHWFGTINAVGEPTDDVSLIKSGLPALLFNMPEEEMQKNTIRLKISRIQRSAGGEYCVLQNGIWYT